MRIPILMLTVSLTILANNSYSQKQKSDDCKSSPTIQEDPFRIELRSGSFVPKAEKFDGSFDRLFEKQQKQLHVLVQFQRKILTPTDSKTVKGAGIKLHHRMGRTAFLATLQGDKEKYGPEFKELFRWAGKIKIQDKLSDRIFARKDYPWNRDEKNYKVLVTFFGDVSRKESVAIFEEKKVKHAVYGSQSFAVVVPRDRVKELAKLDEVMFIEQGPAPRKKLMDQTRLAVNAELAQKIDFANPLKPNYLGVSGKGFVAAICDWGIDDHHNDFKEINADGTSGATRVIKLNPYRHQHGTTSGSIVGGNGKNSAPCFDYRGIAPECRLLDLSTLPSWGVEKYFYDMIVTNGAQVSNHSYQLSSSGSYSTSARIMDQMIRGDLSYKSNPIPPRAQVWAVGNSGIDNGELLAGYYSVYATGKNIISVGGFESSNFRISANSSMGPTQDGRLKPELVAPSVRGWDSMGIGFQGCYTAEKGSQNYVQSSGTSAAAPVVTGSILLMAHSYKKSTGMNPTYLPSTYKAVLIQTATDIIKEVAYSNNDPINYDTLDKVYCHKGPDFATGYGLINVDKACKLMTQPKQIKEGTIRQTNDVETFYIDASAGDHLKFTLTWDDSPGNIANPQTVPKLVNDLDILVTSPDGSKTFQPWVIPALPAPSLSKKDMITNSNILAAIRTKDSLNNVEMVTVPNVAAGRWKIQIKGHMIDHGPQRFSLVASHPLSQ